MASSKPTSVPMLGMSLPRLPFSWEQPFCRGVSKLSVANKKWDRKKKLAKKNLFYRTSMYVIGNMSSTDVLRNKSKRMILLIA
jgi:hypothetical protein